ncbi:MMS19 nucleotide excision repair protein [Diorhabda carinulata]|uniref:MMS19 nucleotide excision repair protein n=1 Tax=Diorhabda carinulata TaxID=1163345 RepID=UPI0025A041DD|nr:MMS19 nucleotide excision repair protein [Diorhabda carinulata]
MTTSIMDLKRLIDQLEDKEDSIFRENTSEISKGILEDKITILSLIEQLDQLLTDEHASKRELGTTILTEVLRGIPLDYLNVPQLEVLALFYSSKLEDHHQVIPTTLLGILTLIQFKNFPGKKVPILLNAIFKNVPCQQQQRADRYHIYQIFEFSLREFKEELLALKLEFVYMVLMTVDGERDPKNLLFLFKWMRLFLSTFSLQHLTEDIFDVLACYFPVDFRAPPNETIITREALAEALAPCLYAIPDFGESGVTLALEKLDSSLEIAKTDSLNLLKEGCATYPTSVYIEKSSEIWSLIQKEILTGSSNEIISQCLETLSAIISKISEDETDRCIDVIHNIFDTLKGNLLPDSQLFEKSSVILVYVAVGSQRSCKYLIKEIIPILTNIYNMTAYNDQRSLIVKTLVEFTKVHLKYYKSLMSEEVPELQKIPVMCLEVLNFGENSRKIAFECLNSLIPYLTNELKSTIYPTLQSSIFTKDPPETKQLFLQCLKTTAVYFPDEVKQNILVELNPQISTLDYILEALIVLINLKNFRQFVIQTYLEAIARPAFSKIAIKNTRYLIEKEQQNQELLKELIELNLLHNLIESALVNDFTDMDILKDISVILKYLMCSQESYVQKEILDKYFEIIFEKIQHNHSILAIMNGLVCGLRRDLIVDQKLMNVCFNLSTGSENNDVRLIASQCLANLTNKMKDEQNLVEFLTKTKEESLHLMMSSSKNIILTLSWITKALLMRNHSYGLIWLNWLLELLEKYNEVTEGLRIIMKENFDSMGDDVFCYRSPLYRQKTFVYATNKIADQYDNDRTVYLTALGYLLEFAPSQAVELQFPKICRYVLLCLEKSNESQILQVILKITNTICNNNSALIEQHLEDFLDRILKLTQFQLSLLVRRAALQCLITFTTTFPVYKLLPFKLKVLRQLGLCVDDKKRLVRKDAMEARSLWFLLDAPV